MIDTHTSPTAASAHRRQRVSAGQPRAEYLRFQLHEVRLAPVVGFTADLVVGFAAVPGEDRGTAVTVGLTANRFELVNTFYIPFDEDEDRVSPVIARATALLADHGPVPSSAPQSGNEEPKPDHLADIHTVLNGQTRVRTQVVLAYLAEHNPAEYAD